MEKKSNHGTNRQTQAVWLLKSLLCSYVVTGVLLLILAALLYKLNLDEKKVSAGILAIYVISTFAGGFIIGKLNQTKKFLWGLTIGVCYFALLLLISLGIYHSLQDNGANVLTTLLMCAGGGILGGMLA